MFSVIFSFYLCSCFHIGLQICPEEITYAGIKVKWAKTIPANKIKSEPLCYNNNKLITRNCVGSTWEPPANELSPCLQIVNHYNLSSCPPGFDKISKNNHKYCYQIKKPSSWNYPCAKSGGASVITDLNDGDVQLLLNSLVRKNVSDFFWLPAKRPKFFNPVVWHIPGSKWGHLVESNNILSIRTSILKTCLLLDIQRQLLLTQTCTDSYPSLCFYINDIYYPAKCPPRYHSIRYMPDESVCLGIEESKTNLTLDDFMNKKICNVSMGENNDDLMRFIFKKIANINNIPDNLWCWFASSDYYLQKYADIFNISLPYIAINNIGTLNLLDPKTLLSCMACQTEVIFEKPQLIFEYNEQEQVMYLTVYFPSGLWKYSKYDRGIQCFSDGNGFNKAVDIIDMPFMEVKSDQYNITSSDYTHVDKVVYEININTDRAAQYWCEGHTTKFYLIKTDKIVVNPLGDEVHVFSLVISMFASADDVQGNLKVINSELCFNITNIFSANKVILMEYLDYSSNYLTVLLHMDIAVDNVCKDNAQNIQRIYNSLTKIAETDLSKYNYVFVNLSSSMYCLPTTSIDNSITLNWELTPIGHIAAPKQFCLQKNGLPVKRLCDGSYLLGSFWGEVEGTCNQNYQPSERTTFLYKFVKGQISDNDTTSFLTDGLSFVLSDIDMIIPADIYYLSRSLQHILSIANQNGTSIDLGNFENIAWIMDRVMILNNNYLRLAQTLNSTNVILDSLNNIIEILANRNNDLIQNSRSQSKTDYQLAVQPQFILQISYPRNNNISGVAIIKSSIDDNSFTNMEIRPLFINTTLEEVISIENLEIATWVPNKVLNTLKENKNDSTYNSTTENIKLHIIISVFHNDAIFQELEKNVYQVNSRIIGISFPGYISNLINPIPLVYRELMPTSYTKLCGFWNFQPHSFGNVPGYWSNSGCFLVKSRNGLTVCDCYHLTHFGQLLNVGRNKNDTDSSIYDHTKSLNIISLVGSFLSLLGIMGIWITASVFHSWRKKAGTKVLLHLSTSIGLPLVFMIVFNLNNTVFKEVDGIFIVSENLRIVCISLGALLHYSVLASFMWMLITAVLQFIRYVRVLGVYRPSRFMIKFTLIGWGIPIIPVILVLALDKENYIPNVTTAKESKSLICYPSGFYLIVSVVLPICIILIINVTLFVLVMFSISKGPDGKIRKADIDLIGAQLRLSIFLFFLLGLTWIFGVLSFSSNMLWSYLFCLTSTMQGFVLFVYFIICDAHTRNLWVTLMKPQFQSESSRKSITSISSN